MTAITETNYRSLKQRHALNQLTVEIDDLVRSEKAFRLDLETYKPDLSHMSLGEIIDWKCERGRFVLFTRRKSNGKVQTVDQSDEMSLYYKDNNVIDLNLEIEKRVK